MLNRDNRRFFVLFFCIGLLLAFQVRILSKGVKYVGVERLSELTQRVEQENAELEQLRSNLASEQEKLDLYESAAEVDEAKLIQALQDQKKYYEKLLNYTDVQGPGIILIIDDADRDLYQGEDGNNVLVHDQDVGIIVNELRAAGAEAIEINGTRIVFNNTRIVCVGPTVRINDEQMTAPFIIKAIGNRKFLEASIHAPGTFSEVLESYGLFVEANTSVSVKINKYDGLLVFNSMTEYKEGE